MISTQIDNKNSTLKVFYIRDKDSSEYSFLFRSSSVPIWISTLGCYVDDTYHLHPVCIKCRNT